LKLWDVNALARADIPSRRPSLRSLSLAGKNELAGEGERRDSAVKDSTEKT
jgi:hypothetical protein